MGAQEWLVAPISGRQWIVGVGVRRNYKLAEIAERNAGFLREVPQIPIGRFRHIVTVERELVAVGAFPVIGATTGRRRIVLGHRFL